MIHKYLILLTMLACTAAGGCQSVPLPVAAYSSDGAYLPPQPAHGLVRSPDSPIPDVPMPVGFKPVASQSQSDFDGKVRTVRHIYQGRAPAAEAQLFYRQQLWHDNWTYLGKDDHAATATLHFEKGYEQLSVRIAQAKAVTTIMIDLQAR